MRLLTAGSAQFQLNLHCQSFGGPYRSAPLSEAASETLPIAEALRMLRMSSVDELRDWIKARDRNWEADVSRGLVRLREDSKADPEVLS